MFGYLLGLSGMWLLCDGLISIRLYYNSKDENGKRTQSWLYDHSIRAVRIAIGLFLIVGGYLWT